MRDDELPAPEDLMPLSQTLITPHLALAFNIPNPHHSSAEFDSGDDSARTSKRPRLVWTPQLHKRFVDAVAHLGIKNAVPKTIMQLMGVDGLTRENVASHLQKYRLYLKRMQAGGGGDAATDHLFATSPVPPHFLHPASSQDHLLPFLPMQQQFRQFQQHPFMRQSSQVAPTPYSDDLDPANGRKMLTLFPTGDN